MTGENLAISISVFSVFIAALSLGWNIYRDIILKAKVSVTITYGFIISVGKKERLDRIIITATNFGPGKIHLSGLRIKNSSFLKWIARKNTFYLLTYNYTDPLSSKIPCTLDVGESSNFIFQVKEDCFLSRDITHVGVLDTYGRMHWSSKKGVLKAKKEFMDDMKEKKNQVNN